MPAVELEIIADSNIKEHKEFLHNLLGDLGIDEKDKISKSITHLYMKKYSFMEARSSHL